MDKSAWVMADLAAELLPEPPASHDPFGFLTWEELVFSTARRLQPYLGDEELRAPVLPCDCRVAAPRLDGRTLLTLAVLLAHDPDGATCAPLIAGLVKAA